jgi:hypothetical protein
MLCDQKSMLRFDWPKKERERGLAKQWISEYLVNVGAG